MIWCRSQGALTVLCALALLAAASCAPSENEIRRDVRAQFSANPEIARLELSVEVKGRVVYLSGKTATQDEQQQAVSLAQAVKGVKLVVNDMWLNNAALADKIKMALASDPMVGRIPIEVDANGGFVRLMSDQTNREERARAVHIASAVEGVRQVEDRMR
jgi:osmotically-inducible protein OsmY